MSKKIPIKNGVIVIKDFLNRKTYRDYHKIMFEGLNMSQDSSQIPYENASKAMDFLVLDMIETIIIDGINQEKSIDFVENLEQSDFEKIYNECKKILNEDEKQKKKLPEKPEK